MEPESLQEMIAAASQEIGASHYAPKTTAAAGFPWFNLLSELLYLFVTKCKSNNPEKARKQLLAQASKAEQGRKKIKSPKWAMDCCQENNFRSDDQKEKAIHATLLWVGVNPSRATNLVVKMANEKDRLKANSVGEILGTGSTPSESPEIPKGELNDDGDKFEDEA